MSEENTITLSIEAEDARQRLDKVLAQRMPEISRSRMKGLIEEGYVRVGYAVCTDPARKLRAGEVVELHVPPAQDADPVAENIPLTIVHDDADVVVIDKAAGMVVHPSAGHEAGTLVNALLHHCRGTLSGINGVLRPGIVHRLDKDTSGLLVAAKTDAAHKALAAQFADHGRSGPLERLYLALCWGVPSRPHGTIDAALARSTINREKIAVVPEEKGRFALTHYRVLETFAGTDGKPVASLIECALETGRTHQIRVHMAHIGHPLLGDSTYGAGFKTKANLLGPKARAALETLDRQALHAATLGFEHPSGEFLRFESAMPPALDNLVSILRQGA